MNALVTPDQLPPPPHGRDGWPWTADGGQQLPERAPSGAPWPRIAIVTPSYNQGEFIEHTIRSVLLQRYPNLEFRVMDGGSTDGTLDVLRKYEPWLTSWTSGPDGGQSSAINSGLAQCDYRAGTWLNSDDFLLPGALAEIGRYVDAHPDCEFVTGDGLFVDETGNTVIFRKAGAPYRLDDLLEYGNEKYLPQPSVFFSRAAYERLGGVVPGLHFAMDLDLWLRLRAVVALHYVPVALSALRQQPNAKTLRQNEKAMREVESVVRRHLHRGSLPARIRAQVAMRRVRAEGACRDALHALMQGDRAESWASVVKALTLFPPIVFSRMMARPLVRLLLPLSLRRQILHRP